MDTSKTNGKIAVIIPCFNEAASIKNVLNDIHREHPEFDCVVINDCSTDSTSQAARETNLATVIDLPVNLGIGGCVQTGFKYISDKGYQYAVKCDGDGQHLAEEIKNILNPLKNDLADVVVGSRFLEDNDNFKSTPLRRIGIKIFSFINSLLIRQYITDNTSGFRAYNENAIQFLSKHYPSFDYPEPEEIVLLKKHGFRIKEVAVKMNPRLAGESSIGRLKSIYYMIKVILAVIMVMLRPKYE